MATEAKGKAMGSRWLPMMALLRRELFERVRTVNHFLMRSLYVLLLFMVVLMMAGDELFADLGGGLTRAPDLGQTLFVVFSVLQFGLVALSVPLIAASAVVEEKVGRSLGLLLLTDLSYGQICVGKFLARLGLMTLLVLSNVPVLLFASMLGGVEPIDVVRVFVLTLGMAAMFIGVTLAMSAAERSTVRAALASYAVMCVWMLSMLLMLDSFVPSDLFMMWHPVVTLTVALSDPLSLGASWWIAPLINLAVGLAAVGLATVLLGRGVRRARAHSGDTVQRVVEPSRVWSNPVAWREWLRRGKPWRTLLTSLGLGLLVSLFPLGLDGSDDVDFFMLILMATVITMASLYALAVGSSAFAQEKREQTLDLLTLTSMDPWEIVLGKLMGLVRVWVMMVLLVLPSMATIAVIGHRDVSLMAAPLPFVAMGAVVLFLGAIGLFYGVMANSPLQAAFPSVATFIYVATPLIWWPALLLEGWANPSTDGVLFGLVSILGWGALFMPMLILLARHGWMRMLSSALLVMLWCVIVLGYAAWTEDVWGLGGVNPYMLVGSAFVLFIEGMFGRGTSDGLLTMTLFGSTVWGLAALIFIKGAADLLSFSNQDGLREEDLSPGVAVVLSVLLPGAGQLYLGHVKRGAIWMVSAMLTLGCAGLLNIGAAIDAWRLAKAMAEERRVRTLSKRGCSDAAS